MSVCVIYHLFIHSLNIDKFSEDSTCQATGTGVPGYMVCWNSESKTSIKGGKCCNDFNTDSADVGCMRDGDNPQGDRYKDTLGHIIIIIIIKLYVHQT